MESNEVKRMSLKKKKKKAEAVTTLRKTVVPPLSGSWGSGFLLSQVTVIILIFWYSSFFDKSRENQGGSYGKRTYTMEVKKGTKIVFMHLNSTGQ